ncbi:hypothetical protein D3C87_1756440 [compost metagenome]
MLDASFTANARALGSRQAGSLVAFDLADPGAGPAAPAPAPAETIGSYGYDAVPSTDWSGKKVASIAGNVTTSPGAAFLFGRARVQNAAYHPRIHA